MGAFTRGAITERLSAAGCVAAADEADELLDAAGPNGVPDAWVRRREAGEPLAWIVGAVDFAGRRLTVHPSLYVPRYQTEALARRAAALLARRPGPAADLCSGTGAIAAHLRHAVPAAPVVAVDADPRAVRCSAANGVRSVRGDLGGPLRSGVFALVSAVAPYVPTDDMRFLPADVQRWEPPAALDGGPDGLDLVRRIIVDAARLLLSGGWLVIEVGGDQDRLLADDLTDAFQPGQPWWDEDGDLRGLVARRR